MDVQFKETRLEGSQVSLSVHVASDEVDKVYESLIAKYIKEAAIRGFRKGHVPRSVLEERFGSGIEGEAIEKVIDESYREVFGKLTITPLGIKPPELKLDREKAHAHSDLDYTLIYDAAPQVDLKDYKGKEITSYKASVSDEDVQSELEKIQKRNAVTQVKKEGKSVDGDKVTVDFWEVEEDGETAIPGTKREDFTFTIGDGENLYKFDKSAIGLKIGDEKLFSKHYAKTFSVKEFAGQDKKLMIKLKAMSSLDLPDIDDELAQDVSSAYKTLDDLKAAIRKDLEKGVEDKVQDLKIEQLLDTLRLENPVNLPESLIEDELQQQWKSYLSQTRIKEPEMDQILAMEGKKRSDLTDEWRPDIEKRLANQYIMNAIKEDLDIKIEDTDVDAEIERRIEDSTASSQDSDKSVMRKQWNQPQIRDYVRQSLLSERLYKALLDTAKIKTTKELSASELIKL